jgi:transcriptional regulator with XRE-family HTH domain
VSRSRLDRELIRRGWTANDLALAAGVSAATLSGARHGRRVAPRTLRKIALALSKAPVVAGIEELLERTSETDGRIERP